MLLGDDAFAIETERAVPRSRRASVEAAWRDVIHRSGLSATLSMATPNQIVRSGLFRPKLGVKTYPSLPGPCRVQAWLASR
jgi:hypothetical protein